MLDGREVSETEKVFLMNWKAMRKAHKRHQKSSTQIPSIFSSMLPSNVIPPANKIYSSTLPPTLPALPARQLPRRRTKHNQPVPEEFPRLINPEEVQMVYEKDELTLPELVPVLTQPGSYFRDKLRPLESWRTTKVITGGGAGDFIA